MSLNDGNGLNRIQGGNMDGLTLGVNWYLNNNLKVQFEWVYDHRYDLPTGPGARSTQEFDSHWNPPMCGPNSFGRVSTTDKPCE